MNNYQIKQIPFTKDSYKTPDPVKVEGHSPGHAYRNYLASIEEEFTTIQEDNIGSDYNPCVRFISTNNSTDKKFIFYIEKL